MLKHCAFLHFNTHFMHIFSLCNYLILEILSTNKELNLIIFAIAAFVLNSDAAIKDLSVCSWKSHLIELPYIQSLSLLKAPWLCSHWCIYLKIFPELIESPLEIFWEKFKTCIILCCLISASNVYHASILKFPSASLNHTLIELLTDIRNHPPITCIYCDIFLIPLNFTLSWQRIEREPQFLLFPHNLCQ